MAKSARRTFSGPAVWAPGDESINELYLANERQHEAIHGALAAGSPEGARALAREHVLASFRLLETILEQVGPRAHRRARRPAQTRFVNAGRARRLYAGATAAPRPSRARPARARRAAAAAEERLVFVVGSPRSGTTFLAGAIGAHARASST